MLDLRYLRTFGLASALVLGGAMATSADTLKARTAGMPKTVPGVTQQVDQTAATSAEAMRDKLMELGFTNVDKVEQSGDIYTTKAQWQGRWVELRIDHDHGGITYENIGNPVIHVDKQADAPVGSSEAELRDELQRVGYSDVSNIEADGNVITAEASRYGQRVNLRIDAETGEVVEESRGDTAIRAPRQNMSAADLREQLAPLGYTDVRNVNEQGNIYTVDAYRNGQWVALRINARDGGVTVGD